MSISAAKPIAGVCGLALAGAVALLGCSDGGSTGSSATVAGSGVAVNGAAAADVGSRPQSSPAPAPAQSTPAPPAPAPPPQPPRPISAGASLRLSERAFAPDGAVDYADDRLRYGAVDQPGAPGAFLVHKKIKLSEPGLRLQWRVRHVPSGAIIDDWEDVPSSAITVNAENLSNGADELWVKRWVNGLSNVDVDIDLRLTDKPVAELRGNNRWRPAVVLAALVSQSNNLGLLGARSGYRAQPSRSRFNSSSDNRLFSVAEVYAGTGTALLTQTVEAELNLPVILVNRAISGSQVRGWLDPEMGGGCAACWRGNVEEWLRWGWFNALLINIGETDSGAESALDSYGSDLRAAIGSLRRLVGARPVDLPALVTITGAISGGSPTGLNRVRQMQLDLRSPQVDAIYVSHSAVGFTLAAEFPRSVHYTPEAYDRHGRLYANSLLNVFGRSNRQCVPGLSDPMVSSSVRIGDDLDLTVHHCLGNDIAVPINAALALKFRRVADQAPVVPRSIRRLSASTLRVTLPSATGQIEWRNVDGNAFELTANNGLITDNSVFGPRPLMPTAGWLSENHNAF